MEEDKIAFLDTVHPILDEGLVSLGFKTYHYSDLPVEELKNILSDFKGLVVRSRIPMQKEFLHHLPSLKFIARSGAGMENIDTEYCKNRGIELFNAPEGNRNAVGEHALGMLLSLFNKLHTADLEVKKGKWDREGNRGIELDGKTVGIIGFGNNGSAFAKKLLGFEVQILAYDKYKTNYAPHHVKETSMEEIFKSSDVISFHIPQNEETLFMGDDTFFRSFQKDIYVINLSRGKIIKTQDLVKHLKTGKIKGACLDVLEYEKSSFEEMFTQKMPEDFEYLIQQPNVILSPHVGGWTVESYEKLSSVLLDKIKSYLKVK